MTAPQPKKTAVILLNLGGPWNLQQVRGFLFRLFADRAIIDLPWPLRLPLACLIAVLRTLAAKKRYHAIGGGSPLLAHSRAQAHALEAAIKSRLPTGSEAKCWVAMRYNHPYPAEMIEEAKQWGASELLFVPLYPHYSTTTSESSLKQAAFAAHKHAPHLLPRALCCYPTDDFYVNAYAAQLKDTLTQLPQGQKWRVLFSAHGVPQKVIDKGDPYRRQIEAAAAAIAAKTGLAGKQWQICFQSRVGPVAWTRPSLDEAITQAAGDKIGLVVLPLSFTSDHIETLHELDIEYRQLALEQGVPFWLRVAALGTNKIFIAGLADAVMTLSQQPQNFICPPHAPGTPCAAEQFFAEMKDAG